MVWIWPGLMMGGAIGAVLALLIAKLDPDALKFYLGVVTALMGAGIAVAHARYMDARTDRRAQKRKLRFVTWSISRAEAAVKEMLEELQMLQTEELLKRTAEEYRKIEQKVAGATSCMLLVALSCEEEPSFEDIVESDEDVIQAHNASIAFRYFKKMCDLEEEDKLKLLAEYACVDPDLGVLKDYAQYLQLAGDHFHKRAPWEMQMSGRVGRTGLAASRALQPVRLARHQ